MFVVKLVMEYGLVCSIGGGIYYVFFSYGLGFCMLNDLVVIVRDMIDSNLVSKVFIVDLDVYQVQLQLKFVWCVYVKGEGRKGYKV